jgi:hypothetical protein
MDLLRQTGGFFLRVALRAQNLRFIFRCKTGASLAAIHHHHHATTTNTNANANGIHGGGGMSGAASSSPHTFAASALISNAESLEATMTRAPLAQKEVKPVNLSGLDAYLNAAAAAAEAAAVAAAEAADAEKKDGGSTANSKKTSQRRRRQHQQQQQHRSSSSAMAAAAADPSSSAEAFHQTGTFAIVAREIRLLFSDVADDENSQPPRPAFVSSSSSSSFASSLPVSSSGGGGVWAAWERASNRVAMSGAPGHTTEEQGKYRFQQLFRCFCFQKYVQTVLSLLIPLIYSRHIMSLFFCLSFSLSLSLSISLSISLPLFSQCFASAVRAPFTHRTFAPRPRSPPRDRGFSVCVG